MGLICRTRPSRVSAAGRADGDHGRRVRAAELCRRVSADASVVDHDYVRGWPVQAQPTGQSKAPLFAEAPDKFFLRVANVQVTFTKTPSGEVAGLILHQGGRDQTGRKVK